MKKCIKSILVFILIIPIIIYAGTYDSEKEKANNYILSYTYKTYQRYLIEDAKFGYSSSGKISTASGFEHGGFISKYEYENSKIKGSSYLYTTTNYWTLTSDGEKMYVVDIPSSQPKNSSNRARVTEFVKKDIKVTGHGTSYDPWVFVPLYKVTVRSNDTSMGTINEGDNNNYYERGQNATIGLNPISGFKYIKNSCGATYSDKKITINRIFKDTECEVIFGTGVFVLTLGEDSDEVVPRHIYLRFNDGFYSNPEGTKPISSIVSYAEKTGYHFVGLETDDGLLVIDENKNIINSTVDKIDDDIQLRVRRELDKYTVTFDANGGSVETTSKTVTFSKSYGELPVPTKRGYKFDGWFTNSSTGTKITDETIVTTVANHTLYAHWLVEKYVCEPGKYLPKDGIECATCTENYYCEGGTYDFNASSLQGRTACPSGMTSAASSQAKTACKITCEAGKYLKANATSCSACDANYYCVGGTYNFNASSLQGRTACPSGMTSAASSQAKTACKITCDAGTYLAKSATSCSNCTAGNECAGKTCNYSDSSTCGISKCTAGTFSGAKAQSCKNCAKGSYSAAGASGCTACQPSGATGTSGTTSAAGSSSCNASCSKSNVSEWETASWSNNSVSNLCKIKKCKSGYSLSSNSCVSTSITITLNGGRNEKITCTGSNGGTTFDLTLNANGKGSKTTTSGTYSCKGAKSGYTRKSTLTANGTINVYPAGAVFWYGNGGFSGTSLFSVCGGIDYKYVDSQGTHEGTMTSEVGYPSAYRLYGNYYFCRAINGTNSSNYYCRVTAHNPVSHSGYTYLNFKVTEGGTKWAGAYNQFWISHGDDNKKTMSGTDSNKCYSVKYVNDYTARIWSWAYTTKGNSDIYHEIYSVWRSKTACGYDD